MNQDISSVAHSAVKSAQFWMAFSTIQGDVTSDRDRFLVPRISAATEYEDFCYLLNRTSRQNEIYKTAHLQSLHRVKELGLERARII